MQTCPLSGPSCKRNIVLGGGPYKKPKCPLTDPPDCPYKQERCPLLPPLPPCPSERPLVTMSASGVPTFDFSSAVPQKMNSISTNPPSIFNGERKESSGLRDCPCSGGKAEPSPPCPLTQPCPPCPPCPPCSPCPPPPCCPLSKSNPDSIPSPCCPPSKCPKPCCPPPCPPPALPLSLPPCPPPPCPPPPSCCSPPPCCCCPPSKPQACPPPRCKPCCSPICSTCKPTPCPTLKCCCPLCLTLCPSSPPIPSLCPCDRTKCPLKSKACILTKDPCPLTSPKCPPPCTWLPEPSPMLPDAPPINSASCTISKECPFESVPLVLCDDSCPCGKDTKEEKPEECCPYAPKHLLASLSQKPSPFRQSTSKKPSSDCGTGFHVPTCPLSTPPCSIHPSVAQIPTKVPICPFYPDPCPLGETCPYPLPPNVFDTPKPKSVRWSVSGSGSKPDLPHDEDPDDQDLPRVDRGGSENVIEVLKKASRDSKGTRMSDTKAGSQERRSTDEDTRRVEDQEDTPTRASKGEETRGSGEQKEVRASNDKKEVRGSKDEPGKKGSREEVTDGATEETRGSGEQKGVRASDDKIGVRGSKEEKEVRSSKENKEERSSKNENEVRGSMGDREVRTSKDANDELCSNDANEIKGSNDPKEVMGSKQEEEVRTSKENNVARKSKAQISEEIRASLEKKEEDRIKRISLAKQEVRASTEKGDQKAAEPVEPVAQKETVEGPSGDLGLGDQERKSIGQTEQPGTSENKMSIKAIQSEPITRTFGTQSEPKKIVEAKSRKSVKTSSLQGFFKTEEEVTSRLCRNLADCPGWGKDGKRKKRSRKETPEERCALLDVMKPRPCPCYPPVPVCPLAPPPGANQEGASVVIQCPYMPTPMCPKAPPPTIKVPPCPGFVEPQI